MFILINVFTESFIFIPRDKNLRKTHICIEKGGEKMFEYLILFFLYKFLYMHVTKICIISFYFFCKKPNGKTVLLDKTRMATSKNSFVYIVLITTTKDIICVE